MRLAYVFLSFVAAAAIACDGKSLTSPQSQPDAQSARVPLNHRPSGASCPVARGPGSTTADYCSTDGGPPVAAINGPRLCESDGDCAAGSNGRCFLNGGPVTDCGTRCSYDACASDQDCPGNEPCECRTSSADPSANSCLTGGNCRVDGDCGQGGYCSPSQVNNFCFCPSTALCGDAGGSCYAGDQQVSCACGDSCGHSYFCHTKKDGCVEDSDCGNGQSCNYDTVNGIWDCATCWPVP